MEICKRDDCLGCGLCAYECPVACISMIPNEEGFLEPHINEKICLNCGNCKRNCPANTVLKKKDSSSFLPRYYLAWHISDEIRFKSSSGAAFSAIATPIVNQGGIVIGAEYSDDFTVFHGYADTVNKLELFRKSKYLQSNISPAYIVIQKMIENGKVVLFTGTPCQCAAMEKAFGKNKNFYSCDVICHGVQSPKVFLDALHYMEKVYGGKCRSVDFRSKTKGWANACTTEVIFDNSKVINKRANDIPIGAAFLKNLSIRQCCEKCKYRTIERASDITIGDFWAIRDEPEYLKKYNDLGFSSVIVNSDKGMKLLEQCRENLHIEERTEEQVKFQNNPLYRVC